MIKVTFGWSSYKGKCNSLRGSCRTFKNSVSSKNNLYTIKFSHFIYMSFWLKFYWDIIDPHVVVRNITEKFCVPFTHFPPMAAFVTLQYKQHSLVTDMDNIHWSYSDFPLFTYAYFVCAYLVLYNVIQCVGCCIHHHSQDTEQFRYHKDPSSFPFITTHTSTSPTYTV